MKVLDTNIVLRFLLNDDKKLAFEAKRVVESNGLYLDEVVLAEVVWVLRSYYKKDKVWMVDKISGFIKLPTLSNPRKHLMLAALEVFEKNNLSFVDCWICVVSRELGVELATQDKKLKKMME